MATIKSAPAVKPADWHATIQTQAGAREAFDKINNVPAWWTKNFTGSAQKLNDVFTVRFTVDAGVIWKTFRVTEFAAARKMVWEVTDCHLPWLGDKKEWKGTKLVWEISDQKGSTRIDFTHAGLTAEKECYDDCNRGWNFFIHESVQKLLDENQGEPHAE